MTKKGFDICKVWSPLTDDTKLIYLDINIYLYMFVYLFTLHPSIGIYLSLGICGASSHSTAILCIINIE